MSHKFAMPFIFMDQHLMRKSRPLIFSSDYFSLTFKREDFIPRKIQKCQIMKIARKEY